MVFANLKMSSCLLLSISQNFGQVIVYGIYFKTKDNMEMTNSLI